jgi:hypothetical protein
MRGVSPLKYILISIILAATVSGSNLERTVGYGQKASANQTAKPLEGERSRVIVVQNYYYANPGQADEVYRWRLHASDVREKLGFPRGRVLRQGGSRNETSGPNELPDVIWECEYPSIEARERDAKEVAAAPEFQAVQKHMGTLIRRFERGTYEAEEPSKQKR